MNMGNSPSFCCHRRPVCSQSSLNGIAEIGRRLWSGVKCICQISDSESLSYLSSSGRSRSWATKECAADMVLVWWEGSTQAVRAVRGRKRVRKQMPDKKEPVAMRTAQDNTTESVIQNEKVLIRVSQQPLQKLGVLKPQKKEALSRCKQQIFSRAPPST